MNFVRLSTLLLVSALAFAQTPSAYQEFNQACTHAFSQSQESADSNFSKDFCACVTQESKSQKTTLKALRLETARIQKDPKAQIRDPRLLAAFHYCTMEILESTQK